MRFQNQWQWIMLLYHDRQRGLNLDSLWHWQHRRFKHRGRWCYVAQHGRLGRYMRCHEWFRHRLCNYRRLWLYVRRLGWLRLYISGDWRCRRRRSEMRWGGRWLALHHRHLFRNFHHCG